MTSENDSCGKAICRTAGGCIFATIWDIFVCPFVSCYRCTKYTCEKCCCSKSQANTQV